LKRVTKSYREKKLNVEESQQNSDLGIQLGDYIQIFSVLIHIDDVDKVRQEYEG